MIAPTTTEEVVRRLGVYMDWLVGLYVDINNIIHWSHDKYYYEAIMMGLIDTAGAVQVERID
jgi:formate C-acetyltransferase